MKYILIITFIINICYAKSTPNWWYEIEPKTDQIIGYGKGATLKEAKGKAMREIAEEVSSQIVSNLKITKVSSKEKQMRNVSSYLEVSANEKLNDLKPIKALEINGTWYIAMLYDFKGDKFSAEYYLKQEMKATHSYNDNAELLRFYLNNKMNKKAYDFALELKQSYPDSEEIQQVIDQLQ